MVKEALSMGNNERTFAIVLISIIVGIVCAILLQLLWTQGIIIDEYTTGTITLQDLQLGCIILWTLFGLAVAALNN